MARNWAEQFSQSLSSFASRNDKEPLQLSLDDAAAWVIRRKQSLMKWYGKPPIDEDLYLVALHALAKQHMEREVSYNFLHPATDCESPIEVPLALALPIVGRARNMHIIFKDGLDTESQGNDLEIVPQAQIGKYRVDFLLTLRCLYGFEAHPINIQSQVIVECDGHDFHERTKEQAINDRSKDRNLQQVGFKIFRYTGSEIWADVFKCAEDVISFLHSEDQRQFAAVAAAEKARPVGSPPN